jgi:hypothetical protein
VKTYAHAEYLRADLAWQEFGGEWSGIRARAAEAGMLYPPSGSPDDDRDALSPSQRAIVYRAMTDTPRALVAIIGRSHSWREVVAAVIAHEAQLRRKP